MIEAMLHLRKKQDGAWNAERFQAFLAMMDTQERVRKMDWVRFRLRVPKVVEEASKFRGHVKEVALRHGAGVRRFRRR